MHSEYRSLTSKRKMFSNEPIKALIGSSFLLAILSLKADLVYRFYRINGPASDQNYCFYDNFFYGWYYRLSTIFYFTISGLLLHSEWYGPENRIWSIIRKMSYFSFFIESQAIFQFIMVAIKFNLEHMNVSDIQMISFFVIIGLLRWIIALFHMTICMDMLEHLMVENCCYSPSSYGFGINRLHLNQYYGWFSQTLADYVVAHYLVYHVLYPPSSIILDGKLYPDTIGFMEHQNMVAYSQKIIHYIFVLCSAFLYWSFARKEITFLNFVV